MDDIELPDMPPKQKCGGWISVEDRLPEAGSWVLAFSNNMTEILFYDGGQSGHEDVWLQDGDWENDVTHWRPLPKPPNDEV